MDLPRFAAHRLSITEEKRLSMSWCGRAMSEVYGRFWSVTPDASRTPYVAPGALPSAPVLVGVELLLISRLRLYTRSSAPQVMSAQVRIEPLCSRA